MTIPARASAGSLLGVALFVVAAALLPLHMAVLDDALFRIATLTMMAVSWNLMANAGLLSLGQSAFWGVGTYACVLAVNQLQVPFAASFPIAAALGAATGVFLAAVTGRLRGVFFAIATLALSEGLRVGGSMLPDQWGGPGGVYLEPSRQPAQITIYLTAYGLAALVVIVALLLSFTRMQYANRAMRDNEAAAQMLGLDPMRARISVCAIAGAFGALGGGINIWHDGYLNPDLAFDLSAAILAQVATILGGLHTLAGPVFGAVLVILLLETTRHLLGAMSGFSLLIYGAILVCCILFLPNGIIGAIGKRSPVLRRKALS